MENITKFALSRNESLCALHSSSPFQMGCGWRTITITRDRIERRFGLTIVRRRTRQLAVPDMGRGDGAVTRRVAHA